MIHISKFVVLLFCIFQSTSSSLDFGPVPYSIRYVPFARATTDCKETGWTCKDCNTLRYCDLENGLDFAISCSAQFSNKPYCNPKTNSCDRNETVCENSESDFVCPGVGVYPDLTNCKRYISCSQVGKKGMLYNCLFQSVYVPSSKRCLSNYMCYTPIADCGGKLKIISYKPDPKYYVICRGQDSPILKECPKNLVFNLDTLQCEFKCTEEGSFSNPSNKNQYYICVYNNRVLQRVDATCREGSTFNDDLRICVESSTNRPEDSTSPTSRTSASTDQSQGSSTRPTTTTEDEFDDIV